MFRNFRLLFTVICICCLCILLSSVTVYAKEDTSDDWPEAPTIDASAILLMDAGSGAVLYESHAAKTISTSGLSPLATISSQLSGSDFSDCANAYDVAAYVTEGLAVPDFVAAFSGTSVTVDNTEFSGLFITDFKGDETADLVAFAAKDHMTLVCVLVGVSGNDAISYGNELLEYGFSNFKSLDASQADKRTFSKNGSVYELSSSSYVILPRTASLSDTSIALDVDAQTLSYFYGSHLLGTCSISGQLSKTVKLSTVGSAASQPLYTDEESTQTYAIVHFMWVAARIVLSIVGIGLALFLVLAVRVQIIRHKRMLARRAQLRRQRFEAQLYS